MSTKKNSRSKQLRNLAENCVRGLMERHGVDERHAESLVTSLVRQWITYDGTATLFLNNRQLYLMLRHSPLGEMHADVEDKHSRWADVLRDDWEIDPDEIPDILMQLNIAQSVAVANLRGESLRCWVNSQERRKGVENLDSKPPPPDFRRDYHQIATSQIEHNFGNSIRPREKELLIGSLVDQWRRFGVACLFVDNEEHEFQFAEKGEGKCCVRVTQRRSKIKTVLARYGVPVDTMHLAIADLNLGREIEIRDANGIPCHLYYDPAARKFDVRSWKEHRRQSASPQPLDSSVMACSRCGSIYPVTKEIGRSACAFCGQPRT